MPHEIPKLTDRQRDRKTACNEIMFKEISNLFCILFIGFLTPDRFRIFGMSKDGARRFKDIKNRNLVFLGRFHAKVLTVIFT